MRQLIHKFFGINKLFSRFIIIFCLIFMVYVTERVLDIAEDSGNNCYTILAAAGVIFGGELLLLAFKDVLSAKVEKVITKAKLKNEERDC